MAKPNPIGRVVFGLRIVAICPKCGSGMYVRAAPCFLVKKGIRFVRRCVSCGNMISEEKKT